MRRGSWLALALVAGCGWISARERDARWDLDEDGALRPQDCDDQDPAVHPGAEERCDALGVDEDCDGLVNDADPSVVGLGSWCRDADGDGLGTIEEGTTACAAPEGWVADCSDCDDDDPANRCETTTPTVTCGDPPTASLSISARVGEQGLTEFVADASGSVGEDLQFRFDWGDGANTPRSVLSEAGHTYAEPGWQRVVVEVDDPCGRTAAAEVRIAVAAPGGLLWVTTAEDPTGPVDSADTGGAALSLRDALAAAEQQPGPQVIAFADGVGGATQPITLGSSLPPLSDADGILFGPGVSVIGGAAGPLEVSGARAVVAGLELTSFSGAALRLSGDGATADGVTVRDSAVGAELLAPGATLARTLLDGNGDPQVSIAAGATLSEVEVARGSGAGVRIGLEVEAVRIELCRIWGNDTGIALEDRAEDIAIVDSTIASNAGDGIAFGRNDWLVEMRNLIVAFNGGWGAGEPKSYAQGSPDHNLWWANAAGDSADGVYGASSIHSDPMLLDPAAGLFDPVPESPVVDAGTSQTNTDRNGPDAGTYAGQAPDIGAVEVR